MTEAMKITLSTQPADARWGEKATYRDRKSVV